MRESVRTRDMGLVMHSSRFMKLLEYDCLS